MSRNGVVVAKSYLRHPDNFFTGTRTLTLEQRGAFNDLLDLYISRDGDLPDNDQHRARELAIDIRLWKRIKRELVEAGKLEITATSIVPTGAATTLATCLAKSVAAKEAADSRWAKLLKLKKTGNADAMPSRQDKTRHSNSVEIEKPSRKKTHSLPDNWAPNGKSFEIGKEEGYTDEEIRWIASDFADNCKANDRRKTKWDRTFYNWLRSEYTRKAITARRKFKNPNNPGSNNDGRRGFGEIAFETTARMERGGG